MRYIFINPSLLAALALTLSIPAASTVLTRQWEVLEVITITAGGVPNTAGANHVEMGLPGPGGRHKNFTFVYDIATSHISLSHAETFEGERQYEPPKGYTWDSISQFGYVLEGHLPVMCQLSGKPDSTAKPNWTFATELGEGEVAPLCQEVIGGVRLSCTPRQQCR